MERKIDIKIGRERERERERDLGGGVLCRKVYSLLAKVGKEFLI